MFIGIVLSGPSVSDLKKEAKTLSLIPEGWTLKLHHCTLALGDKSDKFPTGGTRILTVTHYGWIEGRVSAFKVSGAPDCESGNPHVTIAIAPNAKPKEAKDIVNWKKLEEPIRIYGKVEICD